MASAMRMPVEVTRVSPISLLLRFEREPDTYRLTRRALRQMGGPQYTTVDAGNFTFTAASVIVTGFFDLGDNASWSEFRLTAPLDGGAGELIVNDIPNFADEHPWIAELLARADR